LPPEQRAIVVLHHYLGWGQAEVAATLGIPLGTVKSRLHYATAALRAAVEADSRTTSAATSEERLA
jgi:RNA polymerase sigma-70 factor, ECF subfamily